MQEVERSDDDISDVEDEPDGSLLTPQHRHAARNDYAGKTDAARRMTKLRIRRRAARMLKHDTPFLTDHVSPEDVANELNDGDVSRGVRDLVAWAYRVVDAAGGDPEQVVSDGMADARGERLDRILEKLEETPGEITIDEIGMLNEHGYIDDEQHTEMFKQWIGGKGSVDGDSLLKAIDTSL